MRAILTIFINLSISKNLVSKITPLLFILRVFHSALAMLMQNETS